MTGLEKIAFKQLTDFVNQMYASAYTMNNCLKQTEIYVGAEKYMKEYDSLYTEYLKIIEAINEENK